MGNFAAAVDDGHECRTTTNPRRCVIKPYGTTFTMLIGYPKFRQCLADSLRGSLRALNDG